MIIKNGNLPYFIPSNPTKDGSEKKRQFLTK